MLDGVIARHFHMITGMGCKLISACNKQVCHTLTGNQPLNFIGTDQYLCKIYKREVEKLEVQPIDSTK